MLKKYKIGNYDFLLVLAVVMLTIIGILVVGSAKEELQTKQIYGAIAGFLIMIILSLIDYSFVLRFYWILYAINIILLIAVAFSPLGKEVSGAQRWLEIGGFGFQPSELAKIILILFFSQFIMKYIERLTTFMMLAMTILFLVIPLWLIYSQPDLSTSIVVILIFCMILFTAGLNWRVVASVFALAIPAAVMFMVVVLQEGQTLIDSYQRNRIMGFLYPEDYITYSYQQLNSVIAIGSGQLLGKGLNNNAITSVKNGDFISQAQTDFIFSIIGEELGFLGCLVTIILVIFIIIKCLIIARKSKDLAGTLIATGVATLFGFQSFINMGVATFLLPNTGIPLPFISYGLTSLLCSFMGVGFVLNIRLQSVKKKNRGGNI